MQAEKSSGRPIPAGSKTKKRVAVWVLIAATGLIVLLVFGLPLYLSSQSARGLILERINAAVDGKVDFRRLSVSWWKGIRVFDFSYVDAAGNTTISIPKLFTRPRYVSTLLGEPAFGETILQEPVVTVIVPDSRSNATSDPPPRPAGPRMVSLPVSRMDLTVNSGTVRIQSQSTDSLEFAQINARLNLRPPGQSTSFSADLKAVAASCQAPIRLQAKVVPAKDRGWTLEAISGDFSARIEGLDLRALTPALAAAKLRTEAAGKLTAAVELSLRDGRADKIDAALSAENLQLKGPKLKEQTLIARNLQATVKMQTKAEMLEIERIDVSSDWLQVRATGKLPASIKALPDFLKGASACRLKLEFDCDLAAANAVVAWLPGLKEDTRITSGRLTGSVETIAEQAARQITAKAELTDLKGLLGTKSVALSAPVVMQVKLDSAGGQSRLESLAVSTAFCNIRCSGPTEAMAYDVQLDLARLQAELGQFVELGKYKFEGLVSSAGGVGIGPDKINASGQASVQGLKIMSPQGLEAREPLVAVDYSVVADLQQSTLIVGKFQAGGSFGTVSVAETLLPLGKPAQKPTNVSGSMDIDLAKLRPFAALFTASAQKMELSGRLLARQFSISGEKQVQRLTAPEVRISDLKITYPQKTPFTQAEMVAELDILFDRAQENWQLNSFKLTSPQIRVYQAKAGRVRQADTIKLTGSIDAEYDLQALSALAAPLLPRGLTMTGLRRQQISFSGEYPADGSAGLAANMSSRARLGFDSAEYMGLVFGRADTDIQIDKGLLTIGPVSVPVNNGQLNLGATADFNREPVLLTGISPVAMKDIQINDVTARALLMYLNPIFVDAVGLSGVANLHCERLVIPLAGADNKNLEVVGTISIDKLRLKPAGLIGQIVALAGGSGPALNMRIRPTRFALRDGRLAYDNMQLDIGDNPVNFAGSVGLDKTLDMQISLPYTFGGRTVRAGGESLQPRITLPLKGTIDKPQLDTARLLQQLPVELEILKGLEKLLK
jgi:hypothetical protein